MLHRRGAVSGTLIEPAVESSLTSGATLRLMRSPMMVGVKARLTPTCLYWMVTVPALAPLCGHDQGDLAAGQEARRLARHGDQVGLGQDRRLVLRRQEVDQRVQAAVAGLRSCSAPVEAALLATGHGPDGEARERSLPVPNRAMLLMFCQLMPTRFSASRLTSATLTRNCTWFGASTRMLLITLRGCR